MSYDDTSGVKAQGVGKEIYVTYECRRSSGGRKAARSFLCISHVLVHCFSLFLIRSFLFFYIYAKACNTHDTVYSVSNCDPFYLLLRFFANVGIEFADSRGNKTTVVRHLLPSVMRPLLITLLSTHTPCHTPHRPVQASSPLILVVSECQATSGAGPMPATLQVDYTSPLLPMALIPPPISTPYTYYGPLVLYHPPNLYATSASPITTPLGCSRDSTADEGCHIYHIYISLPITQMVPFHTVYFYIRLLAEHHIPRLAPKAASSMEKARV